MLYVSNRQRLLRVEYAGPVAVFTILLRKLLDAGVNDQFDNAICDYYGSGQRYFIFDFQIVEFINTSAVAKIYSLHENLKDIPEKVRLCGVRPEILSEFERMNLHTVFEIHPDLDTALASFSKT